MMSFSVNYFKEVSKIIKKIDPFLLETLVEDLCSIRGKKGRIFVIGVGGSAGNAGHFVNDLRKLCAIEAYAPTDNISELTARTNDEGWETVFSYWLSISKINNKDALFILSVGGGNQEKNVSVNIIEAIKFAKTKNCKIFGIVGIDNGYTAKNGDNVIIIPVVNKDRITPHSESFQSVIWHCLVSHPKLQIKKTKW